MAVALIGVQGSGGAGAWPRLQRVINATASALGESFGTIVTTGAPSGTFTPGENLTFTGGGSATLVQAILSAPIRLIIASPSGVISGNITGGTSGAAATVASAEGAFNHPAGDSNQFSTSAVEFGNRVFVLHGNTVYRLNEALGVSGGRCEEAFRLTSTRAIYASDSALNLGMFVLYIGGVATLTVLYGPSEGSGGVVRLRSTDGVTWNSSLIVAVSPYFTLSVSGPGIVHNNNIYWVGSTAASGNAVYDSTTDTFSGGPSPAVPFVSRRSCIFAWGNRLFALTDSGGNIFQMELIAGAWIVLSGFPTAGASSRSFVIPGNDGAMYMALPNTTGYRMYRFGIGSAVEVTRGCLPFGIYTGTGAVTNGWCAEVYTDKEYNDSVVDNGPAESFIFLSTNDSSGTNRACYKWTDDIAHQHTDVRLVSTSNLPACTAAGSGVGKTLTANANGTLTIDSVVVNLGDRILVGNESVAANNGIYVCTDAGSGGTPWVLTRATDFDTVSSTEVDTGAWVFTTAGASFGGWRFVMTTAGPITLEVTGLVWTSTPIMVLQDTGAPQQIRLPWAIYGGGEYAFSPGGLDTRITSILPIPGGERISFRIFKTPGAADVTNLKLRLLYRLGTDNTQSRQPGRWGYIGATSVGSISPGNREITGLTANSEQGSGGGTVYTLDWLAISQDLLSNYSAIGRKIVVYA